MSRESSAPPPAHSHIDLTVLGQIVRHMPGDPSILSRFIAIFLRASPPMMATLRDALLADDPAAVHIAAHTMKSSNAQIGALQLAAKCAELELLGAMGQLLDAKQLLEELEQEYQAVQHQLRQILADHGGAEK